MKTVTYTCDICTDEINKAEGDHGWELKLRRDNFEAYEISRIDVEMCERCADLFTELIDNFITNGVVRT